MDVRKTSIIIKREFSTRVKKRAFIVMTLLAPILICGLLLFSLWLGMQEKETHTILVVDDNYPAFSSIKTEKGLKYLYQDISLKQAQILLEESEQYTGVLYLPKNILASNMSKLYVNNMPSATTQRRIEKQIENIIEGQKLALNNIDPKIYAAINTEFHVSPFKMGSNTQGEHAIDTQQAYVGWVFAIIIYIMIMMYATMVMRGVMEEKINRIVEVIISSVKPFELMLGKVLGVALVGVTQFFLWGVLTVLLFVSAKYFFFGEYYQTNTINEFQMTGEVASQLNQQYVSMNVNDPNNILNRINFGVMIPLFLFYYLGGYFLYSALFAAVGSIVDSQSETQQFVLPLTLPLTLAYVIAPTVIKNPESNLALWSSIFPLTSPLIMMIRASVGLGGGAGIPLWQIALSMSTLIITFLATIYLAGKIYRFGILTHGKKTSFSDIWLWVKS